MGQKAGKFVVAQAINLFGGTAEQGVVLGQFREIEFAQRARDQMRTEAAKRKISRIGIFKDGRYLQAL